MVLRFPALSLSLPLFHHKYYTIRHSLPFTSIPPPQNIPITPPPPETSGRLQLVLAAIIFIATSYLACLVHAVQMLHLTHIIIGERVGKQHVGSFQSLDGG